jgi:hypothetical protein
MAEGLAASNRRFKMGAVAPPPPAAHGLEPAQRRGFEPPVPLANASGFSGGTESAGGASLRSRPVPFTLTKPRSLPAKAPLAHAAQ